MSGELEAAGAMATAGIVAGAIEGRRGEGGHAEGGCLNCGAALSGPYCSQCGQAGHPHRKLTHVLEEFLHGIVHFDTKAWRTLPMVIFRPGTLTRNFVFGKRARYISPIALFLFTIFFMFFVFAFAMHDEGLERAAAAPARADILTDLADARAELRQAQAELEQARTNPDADSPEGLEVGLAEGAIEIAQAQVDRLERELAAHDAEAAREQPVVIDVEQTANDPARAGAESPAAVASDAGRSSPSSTEEEEESSPRTWQDSMREVAESENFVVIDGADALNERIRKKFENPDLAVYKIQQTGYKFSFLLAPLSLPFIALLFLWKRGVTLYDHMAYALYALSFASLLFVAVVLSAQWSWTAWLPGWLLLVGLPVHTYFHLKGAYALGWFSALWRTFFMLIFAIIIMFIFLVLIIVLGLTG
ncbi:MAG TPA: DUF3667 domain-containing protein [Vitreimonas sp.]|uniref:DUF3667 domain-containing protein n=1 Tax=Vitreimonas sp. TaxID=3069702 RepID=UPI002D357AF6|nr:DUF3667 domain-containing protein [Vitreimonas sp.]HYD87951.1 DUF3667 domain-containing protein [Vitreimonas sp.]